MIMPKELITFLLVAAGARRPVLAARRRTDGIAARAVGRAAVLQWRLAGLGSARWRAARRAWACVAYFFSDHVRHRVDQFFRHEHMPGYQTGLALKAFEHGGLAGVGPGAGTVKYHIPDAHSDFIFAVAGEEFGLVLCGTIAAALLRSERAAAAARRARARIAFSALCGRRPGDRRGAAGLHQYGRGGQPAACERHDAAVHFLWRLVAVRRGADDGACAGRHAPALRKSASAIIRCSASCGRRARMTTIVLSAGGTGGHLFPAQALAAELTRRGRKIVVMTDARGTQYPTYFPGAAIEIVPAAAFSDRSMLRLMTAPFEIMAGVIVALGKLSRVKPAAVVGFGGYPSLPVMIAACLARFPTADRGAGRRARPRQSARRQLCARHCRRPAAQALSAEGHVQGRLHRQSGAAGSGRVQTDAPYDTPTADGPLRLLVFGGSQGARALSEIVPQRRAICPRRIRVAARHRAAMPPGRSGKRAHRLREQLASRPNSRRSSTICRRAWRRRIS